MNTKYRNAIAILISLAVSVAFSQAANSVSAVGPVPAPPEVRHYSIDAGQSEFMVHASVGGLLSTFGHNHNIAIKDVSGQTEFTDGTVTPASLRMKIRADSLKITDKVSDSDRETIETSMRDHGPQRSQVGV